MAWIWNVVLTFSDEEFWEDDEESRETCECLERINAWIPHGELVSLVEPTYAEGASYGMTANLYGGGFRHFPIEEFLRLVLQQPWKERESVRVWLKGETSSTFEVYTLDEIPAAIGDAEPE